MYKPIGNYIHPIDERNNSLRDLPLVGLIISKEFIPSVANIIGTDLSNYKIIKKNQFACSLMQVSRDGKMPIAMFAEDEAMMSPAYPLFEVINDNKLLPEYLMMWFRVQNLTVKLRIMQWVECEGICRGKIFWK